MKNILVVLFLTCTTLLAFGTEKVPEQTVELFVTENGFEPKTINVKPGSDVILKIIRKTNSTCATTIQIPSLKIKKDLPLNQTIKLKIGTLKKGEIRFGCGMNMMESGKIYIN